MSISDRLRSRIAKIAGAGVSLSRLRTRTPREPTFRAGMLLLGNGERIPVVIKDVNKTGARIEFVRRVELPPTVTLIEPTLNLRRRAAVAWQDESAAGLRF